MKPPSSTSQSESDPELQRVLEEISDLVSAGNYVDVEAYVASLPEHAEALRSFVASMQLLAAFGDADSVASPSRQSVLEDVVPASRILGDFRILGELGRGGMGIVYDAEQISLERVVALKILPFAAILDDRQLQRFRNEARAAATLHHPHIVPVFSVGSERGVHYYAMQKINGATLAEILADLANEAVIQGDRDEPPTQVSDNNPASLLRGSPNSGIRRSASGSAETRRQLSAELSTKRNRSSRVYFHTIARWGLETAEALSYAHESGVLHRDIKPGNLMLDSAGKIWVTDFGLARIENEASMTMSGDIVGTLRYMAPEQVVANSALVDHRADIYSLGVTLYELVTRHPAFGGNDRNELIHKIATCELTAPRKIEPAIPLDLETIILKAASKAPGDRYSTAQELAEDLSEYLANRPIRAKPPTIVERARKWSRRNQSVTWSAAFILVLITLVTFGGLVWSRNKNTQLRSANEEASHALEVAKGAEARTRKNLYTSTMRQAYADLRDGQLERFAESMVRFIPSSGEEDLRQWEWFYLNALYGQADQILYLHSDGVKDAAWHPQGKYLATSDVDGTICLWNPETWTPVATYGSLGGSSISWHPDGRLLATYDIDGAIRVWDTQVGLLAHEIPIVVPEDDRSIPPPRCDSIAFSPDGTRLAAVIRHDDRMPTPAQPTFAGCQVWDSNNFREVWSYELAEANSVSWSPDSDRLACATLSDAKEIVVLQADSGGLVGRITGCERISQVRWSPVGDRIAACELHHGIKLFDSETFELLHVTEAESVLECVSWNQDGSRIAAGLGRRVQVYDAGLNPLFSLVGHTGNVISTAWDGSGDLLIAGATDGATRIWHLSRDKSPIGARTVCSDAFAVDHETCSFSRTGRFFAIVEDGANAIVVRRVADGAVIKRIELPDRPDTFAWSHGDSQLACVTREGRDVTLINVANDQRQSLPAAERGKIHDVDWNPANSQLAVAVETESQKKGQIDIWDTDSLELSGSIPVGKDPIVSVAWDPQGQRLAAVEDAGQTALVRIWDPRTGIVIHNLTGHLRQVGKPLWSPDGDHLAAFGWDGKIPIWDTRDGTLERKLYGHESAVGGAWHPTEARFVSRSDDSTVRLWDTGSGEEILRIDDACKALVFSSKGSQLYLLGKTLAAVDVVYYQNFTSPELLEYAATVRINRGELDRARELIDVIEPGQSERFFLLGRLFKQHVRKASGRQAGVDGSSAEELRKLLDLWNEIVVESDLRDRSEYGRTTIERWAMFLLNAANQAPEVARHYDQDFRPLIPIMRDVVTTLEQSLPQVLLTIDRPDSIQSYLSMTRRHIKDLARQKDE